MSSVFRYCCSDAPRSWTADKLTSNSDGLTQLAWHTSQCPSLQSFALASYSRVAKVAPGSLGETFARIAAEEEEHLAHAVAILKTERARDAQHFDDKFYRLHLDVMTTLAQMLAKECKDGHCEVCHASCVKPSLFDVSLSAAELRGASLQQYLKTLDILGIPGEATLTWVTQLPV